MKILNVKIVPGSHFSSRWKSQMQIITTENNEYVDNIPGAEYTRSNMGKVGYDWSKHIGDDIDFRIEIVNNLGLKWLKKVL